MRYPVAARRTRSLASSALLLALCAGPARAQVVCVSVGVTPTCPFGITGCWPNAREALGRLDGVESVCGSPDAYNCTADVYLKSGGLPAVDRWPGQFKAVAGEAFVLRGVEVTAQGSLERKNGGFVLRVPGVDRPVPIAPLGAKVQWNFRKGAARQPEPDERDAHAKLAAARKAAGPGEFAVEVVGPLRRNDKGLVLEVREFFPQTPRPPAR